MIEFHLSIHSRISCNSRSGQRQRRNATPAQVSSGSGKASEVAVNLLFEEDEDGDFQISSEEEEAGIREENLGIRIENLRFVNCNRKKCF